MFSKRFVGSVCVASLAACGLPNEGVEGARVSDDLAASVHELQTSNALSTNALTTNALTTNALTTNALTTNALTTNALSTNALTTNALRDPATGVQAASIIRYSARCMLRADQSVTVTYATSTGQVTETYSGALGLQPNWATSALTAVDRRWWGACLAAHTNADGRPIAFSARGPHRALTTTTAEREEFSVREGAFFATYNENASPPLRFYTCYDGYGTTTAKWNSRFCADGNSACGAMFTNVGECVNPLYPRVCEAEARAGSGAYFERCHKSATTTTWPDIATVEVITSHLRPIGTW